MFENEREIFEALNKRLQDEGQVLTVICVGGFVLSHYGMRATQDIDGFFVMDRKVQEIIKEIGDRYGINNADELWLNNSVQNVNQEPREDICEVLYEMSNLKILTAPLDYVAGMKLQSAREQDIEDVAGIIKQLQISTPEELDKRLTGYGFQEPDESLVLESFGLAYGMDWLEKYYLENEEQINAKIRQHSDQ